MAVSLGVSTLALVRVSLTREVGVDGMCEQNKYDTFSTNNGSAIRLFRPNHFQRRRVDLSFFREETARAMGWCLSLYQHMPVQLLRCIQHQKYCGWTLVSLSKDREVELTSPLLLAGRTTPDPGKRTPSNTTSG